MIQWLQPSELLYLQFHRLDTQSLTEWADVKGQARLAASAGPWEQSVLFQQPRVSLLFLEPCGLVSIFKWPLPDLLFPVTSSLVDPLCLH